MVLKFMESKSFNILTWNTRGLVASIPYLRSLVEEADVLCITEHWLHANRLTKLSDIAGNIEFFGRASKFSTGERFGYTKGQGGVAILWDKNLKSVTPLVQLQHDRISGIRLQNENSAVINIFCIYLPACGCEEDILTTLDELGAIIDNTEMGSHNILCGDMNADLGLKGGPRSAKQPDKRGLTLASFVEKYHLTATNLCKDARGPVNTHVGPTGETCIDYVLVPNYLCESVLDCITLADNPLNTSDHLPVKISINLGDVPRGCSEGSIVKKLRWDKLDRDARYNKYQMPLGLDIEGLIQQSHDLNPTPIVIDETIEKLISLIRIHDKKVPRTSFKKNIKPYWCDELDHLKKLKVNAFRKWCNAGRPRDNTNPLYEQNKVAKRNFRRRIKQISRSYDEQKISDAIRCSEIDRTIFWKLLKRERDGPMVKTPSIKNVHGKIVHKVEDILRVWARHFSSLGTPAESPNLDDDHYHIVTDQVKVWLDEEDDDAFSSDPITYQEVRNGISTLNSGKSPGMDGVTKEHLVYAGHMMVEVLCMIFNWVRVSEYIPITFRRGVQVPLYKGKNSPIVDVNNYRGITLLSTFNKLFEVIIWKRLEGWCKVPAGRVYLVYIPLCSCRRPSPHSSTKKRRLSLRT